MSPRPRVVRFRPVPMPYTTRLSGAALLPNGVSFMSNTNALVSAPSFSDLLALARAEKNKAVTVMNGVYDAVLNTASGKSKVSVDVPCGAKITDGGKVSLVYVKFPVKVGKKNPSDPTSEMEDISTDLQACINRLAKMPEVNPVLPKREEGEGAIVTVKPNMQGDAAACLAAFFSGRLLPSVITDERFKAVIDKAVKTCPNGIEGVLPSHLDAHVSAFLEARMTEAQIADRRAADKAAADKARAERDAKDRAAMEAQQNPPAAQAPKGKGK